MGQAVTISPAPALFRSWNLRHDTASATSPRSSSADRVGEDRHQTLATVHISSFEKRRSIQRKLGGLKRGGRVLAKYSRRERSRARKHVIEIARVIGSLAEVNGFEELNPRRMLRKSRVWNRRVMRADWRSIAGRVEGAVWVPPRHTSDACSRCGWVNRDLRGSAVLRCALRPHD